MSYRNRIKGTIVINEPEPTIPTPQVLDSGIYVATFQDKDDHILFIVSGKMVLVMNKDEDRIVLQNGAADLTAYKNYKKVKNFDVKVGY